MTISHSTPSGLITSDATLRGALPADFVYAASTAAYQIEGAPKADGKGPSVWDVYLHTPDKDGKPRDNGDEACDSYRLWKEDVALLKKYGVNTYRFSISWPRIIPDGHASSPPNAAGIAYYSNLVDALLAEGITPFVTLFHWDLPSALDDAYGGFESEAIVADFVAYARVLFTHLGDRVKNWITINEPFIWTMLNSAAMKCEGWGDAKWARYTRTLLLTHAAVVDVYRKEFGGGEIGITLNMDWVVPLDDSAAAAKATQEVIDHWLGMYADPIYHGRFPASCIERFGTDNLSFTDEQWALIKGSNDFFGLNHYGTSYATGRTNDSASATPLDMAFGLQERVYEKDGVPIGNRGENGHPYDVPWGFGALLQHIHDTYTAAASQTSGRRHPIYVTENGFACEGESKMSADEVKNDLQRQRYFAGYVREMAKAVQKGVDVGGYMAWSLLDNLEWTAGYGPRFGITAIDRDSPDFTRHPKDSAYMLRDVFRYLIKGQEE